MTSCGKILNIAVVCTVLVAASSSLCADVVATDNATTASSHTLAAVKPDTPSIHNSFFVSLFADARATRIGDVVLVIISENAQGLHRAASSLDHKTDTTVGPGVGRLDFITLFGFSGSSSNEAKGLSSRQESLQARIATCVVDITPEGNLVIEGSRNVQINLDEHKITLRGIVRPEDVRADNSVYSWNIADAQITYEGSDPARPGRKVGIITRVLNWLF